MKVTVSACTPYKVVSSSTTELEDELGSGGTSSLVALSASFSKSPVIAMLKTWNDKRYEIFCFADNALPFFGQSWLLTADPLTRVSVVFAKLA